MYVKFVGIDRIHTKKRSRNIPLEIEVFREWQLTRSQVTGQRSVSINQCVNINQYSRTRSRAATMAATSLVPPHPPAQCSSIQR